MIYHTRMLILVLDPHPLVCEIISMLIRRQTPNAKILSVNSLKKFIRLIDKFNTIDFVFIEPQSSDFFGSAGISLITQRLPSTKVIAITDNDPTLDDMENRNYFSCAHHIISKRNSINDISSDLSNILNSKEQQLTDRNIKFDLLKISKRQIQMLNFLEKGYTNSQIATLLGIKENTVKVHFFRLFKLLGVNNRLQALNIAKSKGYISRFDY